MTSDASDFNLLAKKYDIKKGEYFYGHTSNYLYLKLKGDFKENEIYDVIISKDMFTDNSQVEL